MLPERPESEEVIGKNDDDTDEDAIGRAILARHRASQRDGDDGLCKIQKEVLHRHPENEPEDENEGVGEDGGKERGGAAGALKDVGEGGKGGEGGEGGACLGRHKGKDSEQELNDGEDGWGELEQDDEDGEDVAQRTGRENGRWHGEHAGHGHGHGGRGRG